MNFTYNAYAGLLDKLAVHYQVVDYHSYADAQNPCILRHDIDMSPTLSIKFAEIEAEHHMKATYFVLLNTGFYNAMFREALRSLDRISALGHEIGLHFDEMQYDDCDSDGVLKEHVYCEADILGRILGTSVKTVSMHRPSKRTLESNYEFDGLVNSYSKTFFDEFKYLSDSRMRWREDVESIVNSGKYNALHILTHPIWYTEAGMTTHDILSHFVQNAKAERYAMLKDNIRDLNEFLSEDEVIPGGR